MKLLKNIFNVALSNIIGFGTSFIINFLLPAILTVADYGNYREYIMYTSITYLFNFGYNDGIYIKYGGRRIEDLDPLEIRSEHNFIVVYQLCVFALMLTYSLAVKNPILALFSTVTLFDTINMYHQNFLQATGQFATFSRANISKSIFYILTLLAAIFLMRSDNYYLYIVLNILSYLFLTVFYEYRFIKNQGLNFIFSWKKHLGLFRVGFFILFANMSLTFVGLIGSWVTKWWYAIEEFAQYSFQNSVLNVILLIVNAVGMVFYNVIAKRKDQMLLNVIKRACIFLGILSGFAFFIFKWIILTFLPKYEPATTLLSVTFIAIPYIMLSRILVANIYKATVPERQYFRDSALYAALSFIFVAGLSFVWHDILTVAMATTLCYICWFFYTSQIRFTYLRNHWREVFLLLSHALCFYAVANFMPFIGGALVYLLYLAAVLFFYRDWLLEAKQLLTD
ncbi:MATE family efflux transporter [Aerococcus sanguinicola]|uniref:oligosaccharide flippase family protein n=1 Tax=unclassified Aerococcus TaxID=2618060 RepID=UPI0008A2D926|nr:MULTISPECIES: oligosaccharide flippase family protein [unclassified Aerococcus]KAB0647967.1 oligosaccharide flippase family protein [Aerococcus sanguinicola]MDK6233467.1 oligosaccharide flippase family protein [Aerococcus sp. UMB10185]MDK6855550.1 oligosaccharide flippase family protein [Aerococcus sp. UMB7533]MDK8502269.1 oligosaccharide flippase family protein [Aerococcus sp. UMB1112A]OFN02391.1 polysaccharide biosynthesis protein [Aerococcus sp. HMSC062A02]